MSISRRDFHKQALALLIASAAGSATAGPVAVTRASAATAEGRVPLILDTDIGDDIDDTWALMQLLRSPGFDLRLITTDFGNTRYRTRLLAKLLQHLGHAHIPLGMGLDASDKAGNQGEWLADYRLAAYPGLVHEDGVQALIDTIMQSPETVILLCIGPVTNIAEALRREPRIAENARFIGMHGSLRLGYDGKPGAAAEWNVKVDPRSLQEVFAAPWDCSITPLDSCGLVQLRGAAYQALYRSEDAWMQVLMDNYRAWLPKATWLEPKPDPAATSSILFDTVAVHLATSEDYLRMEDLPLRVTDDGYTVIDQEQGRLVHCATGWLDQKAFEDSLVSILTR